MEEKNKEKLIEKIIKEQDLIALYTYNSYNKSLGIMQEYAEGLYYSKLRDFIIENPTIIDSFSMKNLYTLIAAIHEKEETKSIIERINRKIDEKLESEEFFCEDIDSEVFLHAIHTGNAYGRIEEGLRKKIGDKILGDLSLLEGTECGKIVENLSFYVDAANFLKYYKDGIFTPQKIETINKMIKKDHDALKYVNFGIFQDEIFEMGSEFCEYIAKFPTLSYQLLIIKEHAPQILNSISSRVKTYDNLQDNLDELEVLITYCARNVFELEDKEIDIDELLECAYRNSNEFELINVNYGKEYNQRLEEKLKEEYEKANTVQDKLNIYLNKVYSLSLKKANGLLKDFGSDLQNIQNISEETREFFEILKSVVEIEDEEEIDSLFNTDNTKYTATRIQKMKREISKEFAIEFATEFENTDQKLKQELQGNREDRVTKIEYNGKEIQQIKLNGKFNLLFHSTDAEFIKIKDKVSDFKEDWNKGTDKKNHIISTTYANQDLFGMAPVGANGVRYAFSTIKPQNIRLMGVSDLNTYSNYFAYDSAKRQYMSANTLAYNSRRVYSEFGIEREGVIPDYVVILDDDSPEVIENSYKAATQFEIPIIFIDKAEIEQEQIQNLKNLLEEFKGTKDTKVLQRLLNTYETNVAGWLLNRSEEIGKDTSYTARIDNTRFRDDFKNIQVEIEEAIKQYISIENETTHSEKDIYEVIKILLDEIELYEGCEETKPISKTKISFDAIDLLESANESLDTIGKSELKVDLDRVPTRKEYELKIQQIVRNALSGEKAITTEDVIEAKSFLQEHTREKEDTRGG